MENKYYYLSQENWPFKTFYNYYHFINYKNNDAKEHIFTVENGELTIKSMWRIQLLAELHSGVDVWDYRDATNWELYHEMMQHCKTADDLTRHYKEYLEPDTYDEYFLCLADVAKRVGCEYAQIKCLVKSLLLKYRRMKARDYFPDIEFEQVYSLLAYSSCDNYKRAAVKLLDYHTKHLCDFYQLNMW